VETDGTETSRQVCVFGSPAFGWNTNQLYGIGLTGLTSPSLPEDFEVSYTYDDNGNRASRRVGSTTDTYGYDYDNHLCTIDKNTPGGTGSYTYAYDYRTRRVLRGEPAECTALTFSGGLSVQEYDAGTGPSTTPLVETVRGSDIGGGIGGVLYTLRGGSASYNAYNSRGDVVSQSNDGGGVEWQAAYQAFGTRSAESGTNLDRQRANTKDEDPTGLLNEGLRYRDLQSGVFITRDPAGFVDGPNVYAYVRQNPWTMFDVQGLQGIPTWETQEAIEVQSAHQMGGEAAAQAVRNKYADARKVAIPVTAGVVVATGVTVLTAGAATPALAAFGLEGAFTSTAVVMGSGAFGSYVGNGTTNVLSGRPFNQGGGDAALFGAATAGVLHVGGMSLGAFSEGLGSVPGPTGLSPELLPAPGSPQPSVRGTVTLAHAEADLNLSPATELAPVLQDEPIYHRLGDGAATLDKIIESGELWGQVPRNFFQSPFPAVKAYAGPLPEGATGFEFTTPVAPAPYGVPEKPTWRVGLPGVVESEDGDWAKIPVKVLRQTIKDTGAEQAIDNAKTE